MDTQLNEDAMLQQQMKFWKTVTPMERVGKPDELNGLAVYLSSDAAGFVTGSNVFCDVSRGCCSVILSLTVELGWLSCLLARCYIKSAQ